MSNPARPPPNPTAATRFTSTGPYAYRKPAANLTAQLAASGETPQERIARLRAAADAQKAARVGWFDRAVERGRVWADRAHRATAMGLIGATVLCGAITAYTVTDIVVTNRKNKRIYADAQAAHLANPTEETRQAAVRAAQNFGLDTATAEKYVGEQVAKFREEEQTRAVIQKLKERGEWREPTLWERVTGSVKPAAAAAEVGSIAGAAETAVEAPAVSLSGQLSEVNVPASEVVGKEEGKGSWESVKGWFGSK